MEARSDTDRELLEYEGMLAETGTINDVFAGGLRLEAPLRAFYPKACFQSNRGCTARLGEADYGLYFY